MPITPGFWTHINDLLGVGKQELVMDGDRANSLKAFVKRALPSQKCLVKQVSLAVRLDPDILGSHRLHFIWHTQPEEKSLGEGGRQSRVRVRAGTQRWRMPLTTRPSPRLCLCILWFTKGKALGGGWIGVPWKVFSRSTRFKDVKKERCWSPRREDQKGANQRGTQLEDPPEVPTQKKGADFRASEEEPGCRPGSPSQDPPRLRRQLAVLVTGCWPWSRSRPLSASLFSCL